MKRSGRPWEEDETDDGPLAGKSDEEIAEIVRRIGSFMDRGALSPSDDD